MIESNSKATGPETVSQSFEHVAHDLVTLAELQGQLLKSDARESTARIARPLAVFLAGALLFVATVPIGLSAIAQGLVVAGVPPPAAYGLVAVTSWLVAGGMTIWAWQRFRAMPPAFARSRVELARNLSWIKDIVENVRTKPSAGSPENTGGSVISSARSMDLEARPDHYPPSDGQNSAS